jgi:hypothetical protein
MICWTVLTQSLQQTYIASIGFHLFSYVLIGFHWFSLVSIGFRMFSFVFIEFHKFSLVFIGFDLFSLVSLALTKISSQFGGRSPREPPKLTNVGREKHVC